MYVEMHVHAWKRNQLIVERFLNSMINMQFTQYQMTDCSHKCSEFVVFAAFDRLSHLKDRRGFALLQIGESSERETHHCGLSG